MRQCDKCGKEAENIIVDKNNAQRIERIELEELLFEGVCLCKECKENYFSKLIDLMMLNFNLY